MTADIHTDIAIIGAGPAGLFAVFEAGLLKMRCHVIDALPQVGGQLSEIYPQKPIYDIPGYPVINAQELTDRLMEQIAPFKPGFTLGERVDKIAGKAGNWQLQTSEANVINAKVVVIAGGLGCFEPRKPEIEQLTEFEGRGVSYFIKNPEAFRGRKVVLSGGGDSALDWTVFLAEIADVTLIHRGSSFRGAPDMAEKVMKLAAAGKITLLLQSRVVALNGTGHLEELTIRDGNGETRDVFAEHFIPLFGLTPKLGPIADWGLQMDESAIRVNTIDFGTNTPGVYAIGDISTYPGKLKLILCAFHEAALMAQSAFRYVYPNERLTFKYTTVYGVPTLP
ncbi:NAD(P)/FAD-dependent oxidoreductase [Mucilaginibacter sp. HD30]